MLRRDEFLKLKSTAEALSSLCSPKKKKVPKKKKGSPNKFPFGLFAKSEFKTGTPKVKVKGAE